MAIPAPAITQVEINEMWIRQDWLDKLGLEAPRTWDELVQVAEAFVTQDPDGNGEDDTIGILGPVIPIISMQLEETSMVWIRCSVASSLIHSTGCRVKMEL